MQGKFYNMKKNESETEKLAQCNDWFTYQTKQFSIQLFRNDFQLFSSVYSLTELLVGSILGFHDSLKEN